MKTTTVNDLVVFENDYIEGMLRKHGCWEPNITNFFTSYLKKNPEATFVDVGACYGYYGQLFEKLTGRGCTAIDANPVTFELCLVNNLKKSECLNRYVGVQKWSEPLGLGRENVGGTKCHESGQIKVRGVKLSDVPPATIYKIDVEGSELEVLESFGPTIPDTVRDIIIEVTPRWSKENVLAALNLLSGANFHLYDLGLYDGGSLQSKYPITKLNLTVLLRRNQTNVWATRNV